MKLDRIERKGDGKFLHRYDLHYTNDEGVPYTYEMVSRDGGIDSLEHLSGHRPDAVVMALTDRENEHFVLIHEFRLELGHRIYGLPGGLIDPGETPEECAERELREETGLKLVELKEVLPAAACAVGLSEEQTVCVIGVAEGEPHPMQGEDTQASWYTREEVRRFHETAPFGSWALICSWMWVNGKL